MCKSSASSEPVQENSNASLEFTSIDFHGPTVLQTVLIGLGMVLVVGLGYLVLRYMWYCGGARRGNTHYGPGMDYNRGAGRWNRWSIRREREDPREMAMRETGGTKEAAYVLP